MRRQNFRETGHPDYLLHKSDSGSGAVIGSPGAGHHILIHTILASSASTIKETDTNGDILAYAPAGCNALGAPILVPAATAVYNDSSTNVTIIYEILDTAN